MDLVGAEQATPGLACRPGYRGDDRPRSDRRRYRLTAVAAALLLLLPPAAAFAVTKHIQSTQVTYFTGSAGGWVGHASGLLVARDYNHMWHACGNYAPGFGSAEYYANGSGTPIVGTGDQDSYGSCHNPLSVGSYSGSVEAWCGGNGPVTTVTCQTTRP